jgi:hypothetical protein
MDLDLYHYQQSMKMACLESQHMYSIACEQFLAVQILIPSSLCSSEFF